MFQGLEKIVKEIFQEAMHRKYVMHLFNIFKRRFPGLALSNLFWKAARAYNERDYNKAMQKIKELNEDAEKWLIKIPAESRSRYAFDPRVRCDHITNNLVESFNSWLGRWRGKPILTMLEGIRGKLMSRMHKRYNKAMSWNTSIINNIKKGLNNTLFKSRECSVDFAGSDVYEVRDKDGVRHIVDLCKMTCICREWDISGIPCIYDVTAIYYNRKPLETFVHPYFSKEVIEA